MERCETRSPILTVSFWCCLLPLVLVCCLSPKVLHADDHHSVAREWNEALLFAIRRDFARPTVHARNLFHSSAAMFDAWAVFDDTAATYFLGQSQINGINCPFPATLREQYRALDDVGVARERAISMAMYRLLSARFAQSPGQAESQMQFEDLLAEAGLDADDVATDIENVRPAALGNYLAQCIIDFGLADGSNEANGYINRVYEPINPPLNPTFSGNTSLVDPDRWQPLVLDTFIDQSGIQTDTPGFLSAEWGEVVPFALTDANLDIYERDGLQFRVYLDPGPPASLNDGASTEFDYLWGHAMVAMWSSHLDPGDGVMWDISPATIGNTASLPTTIAGLRDFYQPQEGGASESGHALNPVTGAPYEPNIVARGDYTRVLAEFWADGPDSETPPGHWFSIYNEAVADHPDFEPRFEGVGNELDALEFDVRAYFLLGGAMHDAAIVAWSAKGWYDYIRPVSALRAMADRGQSTDPAASNYDPQGVPLVPGFLESVSADDFLAGNGGVNIGKIKVRAWRGPSFVSNPTTSIAGVGWILLENWWPYQRPTFVTPPFAGYVSGHSTFSRAAAEVLTRLTGDAYFPGGMAEFVAPANDFLVFEQGPSTEVVLQWATYRDASDQTSLSRIWGGIHPPVDDIPGRRLGIQVADLAYSRGLSFIDGSVNNPMPSDPDTGSNSSGSDVGGGSGGGVLSPMYLMLLLLFRRRFPRN